MSLGTTALLGLKLLSGEAEAAAPTIKVPEAAFMARCATTRPGMDRNEAAALAPKFEKGLNRAMEGVSDRKLERALRYALWSRITKVTGDDDFDLVNRDEVLARWGAVEATRLDDMQDTKSPEPNRRELWEAREETAEDDAILDLVLDEDGKPLSGEELLAKFPQFKGYYQFQAVIDFVRDFNAEYGRDCEKAARYTLKYGHFPAYDLISDIKAEPDFDITATYAPVPGPDSKAWRTSLGREDIEFYETEELVADQAKRARGLDRLKPWCYHGLVVEPKIHLNKEEEPAVK